MCSVRNKISIRNSSVTSLLKKSYAFIVWQKHTEIYVSSTGRKSDREESCTVKQEYVFPVAKYFVGKKGNVSNNQKQNRSCIPVLWNLIRVTYTYIVPAHGLEFRRGHSISGFDASLLSRTKTTTPKVEKRYFGTAKLMETAICF